MTKVVVSFAGGRKGPFQHDYAGSTTVNVVRADAMQHFGVADSSDGSGQVVYRLYRGGEKVEDLSVTVDGLRAGEGALALRLVREVTAG
jgi:hypothetical protein